MGADQKQRTCTCVGCDNEPDGPGRPKCYACWAAWRSGRDCGHEQATKSRLAALRRYGAAADAFDAWHERDEAPPPPESLVHYGLTGAVGQTVERP